MANNPDASFVPYWYYTNMYNSSYGAVGKVEYYTAAIAQGNAALQTETKAKIETLLAEMDAHLQLSTLNSQVTSQMLLNPRKSLHHCIYYFDG